MMGLQSEKVVMVVIAVVVAAELVVVSGNYSIATGGSQAAMDEMRGNTERASCRAAQAGKETQEMVGIWAGWAKEKVQDGLGLGHSNSAGSSGVGQQLADKARKGKEKAYEAVSGAAQKVTEKAQQAKEGIYESAKEASNQASEIKDEAQQHTDAMAEDAQETVKKEEEEVQTQTQAQAQAHNSSPAPTQENLSMPQRGCSAKRRASETLLGAREKISLARTSHNGEL